MLGYWYSLNRNLYFISRLLPALSVKKKMPLVSEWVKVNEGVKVFTLVGIIRSCFTSAKIHSTRFTAT